MLRLLDLRGRSGSTLTEGLPRPAAASQLPYDAVRSILAAVRERGDAALRELTERFDGVALPALRVDPGEIAAAEERVPGELLEALRAGVPSTGHALPMPNTLGPWARHLALSPGVLSDAELIEACGTGLYVTRLWYVRDVHPLRTAITGMTRDGTFLIQDGRLGRPGRDLRFTQSIVDALADVCGVGRERRIERDEAERALLVPSLCLGHFTFTS
jgi:hypothetical protein